MLNKAVCPLIKFHKWLWLKKWWLIVKFFPIHWNFHSFTLFRMKLTLTFVIFFKLEIKNLT